MRCAHRLQCGSRSGGFLLLAEGGGVGGAGPRTSDVEVAVSAASPVVVGLALATDVLVTGPGSVATGVGSDHPPDGGRRRRIPRGQPRVARDRRPHGTP